MEIDVSKPILDRNEKLAAENRALFDEKGVFVLDLMASPGAGKTSTILATIEALRDRYSIAVIEGDIASKVDAEKIKEHGIPAVQINTGGACHLESDMIQRAVSTLDLDDIDLLIVENVGNLVCPASWDLGEDAKVVIFSVTEGEDKPLKYPRMFERSDYCVINKIDLLPYLPFDMDRAIAYAREVNSDLRFFFTSALTGDGMEDWYQFLTALARVEGAIRA